MNHREKMEAAAASGVALGSAVLGIHWETEADFGERQRGGMSCNWAAGGEGHRWWVEWERSQRTAAEQQGECYSCTADSAVAAWWGDPEEALGLERHCMAGGGGLEKGLAADKRCMAGGGLEEGLAEDTGRVIEQGEHWWNTRCNSGTVQQALR